MKTRLPAILYLLGLSGNCGILIAELKPPVLGHVRGINAGTIDRIDGVPGAAQVRSGSQIIDTTQRIVVSAEQNYTVAIRAVDQAVMMFRLDQHNPELQKLSSAIPANRIALSQKGTVAAIYSHSAETIQIFDGLPGSPNHQRSISTTALGGRVESMAVSDDGANVLASGANGSGEVLVVTEKGTETLSLAAPVTDIVFRPHRQEAVILTSHEVLHVTFLPDETVFALIAGAEHGIVRPSAAEFSRDGKRLYIADVDARRIHIIEPGRDSAQSLSCDCSPSGLQRLKGEAVFAVEEPSASLVRILDHDSSAEPRILLVPQTRLSN